MERIYLGVALPRGPQHYWRVMCDLTRTAGRFTITEVLGRTNGVARETIISYVKSCLAQGHVAVLDRPAAVAGKSATVVYRVVNVTASAPYERLGDQRRKRGRSQQQLWSTMRALEQFSLRELVVEASTDDLQVQDGIAKLYVRSLLKAGYLTRVRSRDRSHRFRLRPAMNTGPKPPALLKACFVFDRNRNAAVGVADAEDAS